jgi:2'-5' RNA ligase
MPSETTNLLRTFVAIELPVQLREAVCTAVLPLKKGLGPAVRWVPMENMHLTLKFLGDVSPANVELLSQMLRAEADLFRCFDLQLNGLGCFPTPKRPRVLYIGIRAPAALEALQRGIESAARRLGYESEERRFSPHLTVGRVTHASRVTATEQQAIRRAIEETRIDSLGTARVDSVHLYKSDLQPTGSVYTRLYSAKFRTG